MTTLGDTVKAAIDAFEQRIAALEAQAHPAEHTHVAPTPPPAADMIDIRAAGAIGDGMTDNTAIFATALADGRPIFVPPGVYCLADLSLPAGRLTTIIGESRGQSVLQHRAGATKQMLWGRGNGASLRLVSIGLDGNFRNVARGGPGQYTRIINGALSAIELTDCNVWGGYYGVTLKGATGLSLIKNCWFHDFALHGGQLNLDVAMVDVPACSGLLTVEGCLFEQRQPATQKGNSVPGIVVSDARLIVQDNTFRNLGQDPSGVDNPIAPVSFYIHGHGSIVRRNQFTDSFYGAIRAQSTNTLEITDNLIDGYAAAGKSDKEFGAILLMAREPKPTNGYVIERNTVRHWPDVAIRFWMDAPEAPSGVTVRDNVIADTAGGVYAKTIKQPYLLTGNTVTQLRSGQAQYIGAVIP